MTVKSGKVRTHRLKEEHEGKGQSKSRRKIGVCMTVSCEAAIAEKRSSSCFFFQAKGKQFHDSLMLFFDLRTMAKSV